MILYPKLYLKNIKEINIELLKKYDIKGLIIDVDNTIMDYDRNMLEGIEKWAEELKQKNIKICILSNTNKIEKVKKAAKAINVEFINFAKKPFKKGFMKAKELLCLESQNIGVVGDQIMTDVLGANRCKMISILTQPIDTRDILITKVKRPLEKLIIKKYLRSKKNVF